MGQIRIPAVFMRGGTSKALMFRERDLPANRVERDRIFLAALGSPDSNGRQLNGMGGGLSSLSKVCVVGPSARPDADVDYTFAQVEIKASRVDYSGNCGNMSSAVGPFAVDEDMAKAQGDEAIIRIHNTNTGKSIVAHFPLEQGRARVEGDFVVPGVAGSGAPIRLDFIEPGGAGTSALLPTGSTFDQLAVAGLGLIEASMVDAAAPCVFVAADRVGMSGCEMPEQLDRDSAFLARMEAIRVAASLRMGIARTEAEAAARPSIPKVAMVCGPAPAMTLAGERIAPADADLTVRMISLGQPHRAVPLTGALCLAVAAMLPDTVVARVAAAGLRDTVRIAQPSGLTVVGASLRQDDGRWIAERASVYRTARRLMEGSVLIPASALGGRT